MMIREGKLTIVTTKSLKVIFLNIWKIEADKLKIPGIPDRLELVQRFLPVSSHWQPVFPL